MGGADGSAPQGPRGLRAQIGAVRAAGIRLVQAHVALAQAEAGEIADEVKRLAVGFGLAFALVLFAGLLLPIGTALFLGEWLFGSLGWGVVHGVELSVVFATVAVLVVLDVAPRRILGTYLVGLIVGVIAGVILGLDLTNQAWSRLGDAIFSGIDPAVRPLVTAVVVLGAIVAVVGLFAGLRAGGFSGAIGGLIGGALVGAILGALTAVKWGPQAGAAGGIAIGLATWEALLVRSVMRSGIDFEALKKKLTPEETIETTRETIEWVRKQTPLGRKS